MSEKMLNITLLVIALLVALTTVASASTLVRDVTITSSVNWTKPVLITIDETYLIPYTGLYMSNTSDCTNILPTWYGTFGDKVVIIFKPFPELTAGHPQIYYLCYGDIIHEPDLLFNYTQDIDLNASYTSSLREDSGSTGWYSIPSTRVLENFGETVWVKNTTIRLYVSPNRRTDVTVQILDPSTDTVFYTNTYRSTTWVSDTIVLRDLRANEIAVYISLGRGNGDAYIRYDTFYGVPGVNTSSVSVNGSRDSVWYVIIRSVESGGIMPLHWSLGITSSDGTKMTYSDSLVNGETCSTPVGVIMAPILWGYICPEQTQVTMIEINTTNLTLSLRHEGYNSWSAASIRVDMVEALSNASIVVSGAHSPQPPGGGGGGGGGSGGGGGGGGNGTIPSNATINVNVNVEASSETHRVVALVGGSVLSIIGILGGIWAMVRNRLEYAVLGIMASLWAGVVFNYLLWPRVGFVVAVAGIAVSAVALIDRVIDYITS